MAFGGAEPISKAGRYSILRKGGAEKPRMTPFGTLSLPTSASYDRWSVHEHHNQKYAYNLHLDRFCQIQLSTMPTNCASNNIDFVPPSTDSIFNSTDSEGKATPPGPWPLPSFEPLHISRHGALILMILLAISYR